MRPNEKMLDGSFDVERKKNRKISLISKFFKKWKFRIYFVFDKFQSKHFTILRLPFILGAGDSMSPYPNMWSVLCYFHLLTNTTACQRIFSIEILSG